MVCILLVEDDEITRFLMRTILVRQGYDVVDVNTGTKALQVLSKDNHVALVLTDIMMPEMDGLELTRQLRQTYPTLPILVASAYKAKAQSAMELGASGHILKPFDPPQLLQLVQSVIQLA